MTAVSSQGVVRCRLAGDDDVPELLRLLADAGWGEIDRPTWRSWYRDGPCGPSRIVVAEHASGEIVGQGELRDSRVRTAEGTVSALRMASLVLAPQFRAADLRGTDHPVGAMFAYGMARARGWGVDLLHAAPHRAAILAMRAGGLPRCTTFGCHALELDERVISSAVAGVEPAGEIASEFDDLWDEAQAGLGIKFAIERDAEGLARRGGSDELFVARSSTGRLRGYVRVRGSDGLITDMLARSWESLVEVLAGTAGLLGERRARGLTAPTRLAAVAAPAVVDALDRAGFTPVRYRFGFIAVPLSSSLPPEITDGRHWYFTGGD